MADQEINVGDTVRLKSGGPVMTVDWTDGKKTVCTWFDQGKKQAEEFNVRTLVPAEPDEKF